MKIIKPIGVIFGLMACLCLAGCYPTIRAFDSEKHISAKFFERILYPKRKPNKRTVMAGVDEIEVYKLVFDERLVEHNGLLEVTTVNPEADPSLISYKQFIGDWSEVYLFRLKTARNNKDGAIYFSAKLRRLKRTIKVDGEKQQVEDTICLGFGPSYFGRFSERTHETVIQFKDELSPHYANSTYSLSKKTHGKKKSPIDLIYVLRPPHDPKDIWVSKIVNEANNKIGGYKDLVYDIDETFRYSKALLFKYKYSIKPLQH
jgi:hypothetical protein